MEPPPPCRSLPPDRALSLSSMSHRVRSVLHTPQRDVAEPCVVDAPRTWSLRVVDLGLAGIVVLAPLLFLGERPALGQFSVGLLATLTALAWFFHQWHTRDWRWRFTGVEPIILFAIGLVVLQCQQLSPELLQVLSPQVQEILPASRIPLSDWLPGGWNRVSLTPHLTQSYLAVVLSGAMFFFVAAQRVRSLRDLCGALRWIALSGSVLTLVGLLETALQTGVMHAWLGRDAGAGAGDLAPHGPFTAPGHLAHALCLSLPAQMFLFTQRFPYQQGNGPLSWKTVATWLSNHRTTAWGISTLLTIFVVMLTGSLVSMWMAICGSVCFLVLCWKKLSRNVRTLAMVTGTALVVWCGVLMISRSLARPDVDPLSAPGTLAAATHHAAVRAAEFNGIESFPLLGTGLGSHPEVCWLWFAHPHSGEPFAGWQNSYVRLALETGLTGAGLVVLLALTALMWSAQGLWNAATPRSIGLMSAVTVALVIGLLQAAGDATFYVTACVNMLLLYAVCAWRMSLMRFCESTGSHLFARGSSSSFSRFTSLAAVPMVLGLGGWILSRQVPEVAVEPLRKDYRRLTLAPADAPPALVERMDQERLAMALRAAAVQPRDSRLQLQAGIAYLALFEQTQHSRSGVMPLSRVKELARATIDSPDEMRVWLRSPTVLGEGANFLEAACEHFQKSLTISPLHPRPYLELAELAWLHGGSPKHEDFLLTRAVTVRPSDARARFALGRSQWRAGDYREALSHWKEGFRLDMEHRAQLITALAQVLPAREFLDQFEPDHAALRQLCAAYQKSDDRTGYRDLVYALAHSSTRLAGSKDAPVSEGYWLVAHQCFAELGDRKSAYDAAQHAVACNPSSFPARQAFGLWLFQNGRYAEAVEQLEWCARSRPELSSLEQLAREALAKSVEPRPAPAKVADEASAVLR